MRFKLSSLRLNSAIDAYERSLTADQPTLPFNRVNLCTGSHSVSAETTYRIAEVYRQPQTEKEANPGLVHTLNGWSVPKEH